MGGMRKAKGTEGVEDMTRTLDELLGELEGCILAASCCEEAVEGTVRLLEDFSRHRKAMPERLLHADPADMYTRHLVYHDPQDRYCVVGMAWAPGQATPIHDHGGTWCVEVCLCGRLRITNYEMLEELPGGRVRMSPADMVEVGVGAAGHLIPPLEHHCIENPYEERAVTLHVYGKELKRYRRFVSVGEDVYRSEVMDLGYRTRPGSVATA